MDGLVVVDDHDDRRRHVIGDRLEDGEENVDNALEPLDALKGANVDTDDQETTSSAPSCPGGWWPIARFPPRR
jgi:hypothetical protein